MKFFSVCFFLCIGGFISAQSEAPCLTDFAEELKAKKIASYAKARKQAEDIISYQIAKNENKALQKTPAEVRTIPLVFHVIHLGEAVGTGTNISDAQIFSAVQALNRDFRRLADDGGIAQGNGVDTEIEFCLAQRDPNGNPHSGINRINGTSVSGYSADGIVLGSNDAQVQALSWWDNRYYYNIWVVSEINGNDAGVGIAGYAQAPVSPIDFPGIKESDGTVIVYNSCGSDPSGTQGFNLKFFSVLNRTLTHEIGHGLDLLHPFHNTSSCSSESNCSTEGDKVCDTPPHPGSNTWCSSPDCGGTQQVENYMDYTESSCMNMFTNGQSARMRAALEGVRYELYQSTVCTAELDYDASISNVAAIGDKKTEDVPVLGTIEYWEVCGASFDISLNIENKGQVAISSLEFTYQLDNGDPTALNWVGSIAPGAAADITLLGLSASADFYEVTVKVTKVNGFTDGNPSNNTELINVLALEGADIQATVTDVLCTGGETGRIELTDVEGATYNWSNGDQGRIIENLAANTYTVTIDYSWGCSQAYEIDIFDLDQGFDINFAYSGVVCNDYSKLQLHTIPSAGSTPFTYNWNTGAQTQTISNVTDGDYDVTITDFSGCTSANSVTWNTPNPLPTPPTIALTASPEYCSQANGQVSTSVNGGTGPLTFTWYDSISPGNTISTSNEINSVSAANYCVIVSDTIGCLDTACVVVEHLNAGVLTLNLIQPTSDSSTCDGSVSAEMTGGTSPFAYAWDNGETTSTATQLCHGSRSVTVTDSENCSSSSTIDVPVSPKELSTVSSHSDADVCVPCNSTAQITAIGGSSPYSYLWAGGAAAGETMSILNDLCSGEYYVTVTDDVGDEVMDTVIIEETEVLTITTSIQSLTTDSTTCDGAVEVSATGGATPLSYVWSNNETDALADELCHGTRSISVTDVQNCTAATSVIVEVTPSVLSSSMSFQDPDVCIPCNAEAQITATGGASPYTYNWAGSSVNGVSTPQISNICEGTYYVTVTDDIGDTVLDTILVEENKLLDASIPAQTVDQYASDSSTCDGTLSTVVSGGSTPYTYLWDNGEMIENAVELCYGPHDVTITDAANCSTTANNTVYVETPFLSISLNQQDLSACTLCDVQLSVQAIGGTSPYSYLWGASAGAQTTAEISNLCSGTYAITVTDNDGAVEVDSIIVAEMDELLTVMSSADESCSSLGSAEVSISGGTTPYDISWSNNVNDALNNDIAAGTYYVTVNDANDCSVVDSVTVESSIGFEIVTSLLKPPCQGATDGTIEVGTSGGGNNFSYHWEPGNMTTATVINLSPNTYNLTITNNDDGCEKTQSYNLSEVFIDLDISVQLGSCDNSCNSEVIVLPTGGSAPYTYTWFPDIPMQQTSAHVTGLCLGTYSVSVQDSKGCIADSSFLVQHADGITTSTQVTHASCHDACDGSIDVSIQGGEKPYQIAWDLGSNDTLIQSLCAGVYGYTITDNAGCLFSESIEILNPEDLVLYHYSNDTSVCVGQNVPISFNVIGNSQYLVEWSDPSLVGSGPHLIQINEDTCYQVTVSDSSDCTYQTDDLSICITSEALFSLNIVGDTIACLGDTITLQAKTSLNDSYSFEWGNSLGNTSGINIPTAQFTPGTQLFQVTATNSCQATQVDSIYVYLMGENDVDYTFEQVSSCIPSTITFYNNTSDAIDCLWDFGDGFLANNCDSIDHVYFDGGTYDIGLTVLTNSGCKLSKSVNQAITLQDDFHANFTFSPQEVNSFDTLVEFTDLSTGNPTSHEWYIYNMSGTLSDTLFGSNVSYAFPGDSGTYLVKLMTQSGTGCSDSVEKQIQVSGIFNIFIPNSFTPNEDNLNDVFIPYGTGLSPVDYQFSVFDAWGNRVFYTEDIHEGWDGRVQNGSSFALQGLYNWSVQYSSRYRTTQQKIKSGHVMLLR